MLRPTIKSSVITCLALAAALGISAGTDLAAGPATNKPGYYEVVGVAANDVLYVRERPDPTAAAVASLPPGTGCVRWDGKTKSYKGRPWWRISIFDGMNNKWLKGWVNSKFLSPQKDTDVCDG